MKTTSSLPFSFHPGAVPFPLPISMDENSRGNPFSLTPCRAAQGKNTPFFFFLLFTCFHSVQSSTDYAAVEIFVSRASVVRGADSLLFSSSLCVKRPFKGCARDALFLFTPVVRGFYQFPRFFFPPFPPIPPFQTNLNRSNGPLWSFLVQADRDAFCRIQIFGEIKGRHFCFSSHCASPAWGDTLVPLLLSSPFPSSLP